MTRDLIILLIQLQDELNRLFVLLEVLRIALDQFDQPNEKSMVRVDLLISLYLPEAEFHFDKLKAITNQICQLVRGENDQGDW